MHLPGTPIARLKGLSADLPITVGTPQIRHNPRLLFLRLSSSHLARSQLTMVPNLHLYPTHCLRKPPCLVAPRTRLPSRLRFLGRSGLRSRVSRRQLELQSLPCTRHGRQCCELGTCSYARIASQKRCWRRGGDAAAICNGGSDCVLKIWGFDPRTGEYPCTHTLTGHTDWVRDVAWAPTVLSKSYIASASQDKTVRIWTNESRGEGEWKCTVLPEFEAVVWRVSWSLSGNVLAVSGGDNKVSLWKENLRGEWDCVKWIED